MPRNIPIQFRRGTSTEWTNENPVLISGEPGFDTQINSLKIGDGITAYNNLPILFSGIYLQNIIEDNSPALGHNLDLNTYDIAGTGNIDISGDITADSGNFNQIIFNTGLEDPNLLAGQLQWNSTEGTLDLGLNDNYSMHLGEELLYRVRNVTGSTLLAGQPVYASGLSPGANNRIEVALYAADGTIREIRFMGLITEDLTDNGNNGFATQFGYIRGVDTRGDAATYGTTNKLWASGEPAWNEGDILYVHPSVPGKLTKIEPKHSISVAIITSKGSNGKLFVRPTSYGHLGDNHDVDISGVTNGQFLQYNSSTDYWVPSSSGNFTALQVNGTGVALNGHTHVISDISNLNIMSPGAPPVTYDVALTYNYSTSSWTTKTIGLVGVGSQPIGGWPAASLGLQLAGKASIDDARFTDTRTPTDGSVTTAKIADSNVTYAKMQNVSATDRLLGRSSSGAGIIQEITCTAFGRSLLDDIDAAAGRTTLGAAPTANPVFTGVITVAAGSAGAPALTFADDTDTGVYRAGVNSLAFSTNGTEQIRIGPDGEVGIGITGSSTIGLRIRHDTNANNIVGSVLNVQLPANALTSYGYWTAPSLLAENTAYTTHIHYIANAIPTPPSGSSITGIEAGFQFGNTTQQHAVRAFVSYLNSATGYERYAFIAAGSAPSIFNGVVYFSAGTAALPSIAISSDTNTGLFAPSADNLAITTGGTERLRVDSSGKILVGATTSRTAGPAVHPSFQIEGTNAGAASFQCIAGSAQATVSPQIILARHRGAVGASSLVQDGDTIGIIRFNGGDDTDCISNAAVIECRIDGTPGSNDMPGRLMFSTTSDGAATSTERMRIKSNGVVRFIPLSADPASAEEGDMYFNSTSKKLKVYNGTSWVDLH